jgi:hypothetical protein
LKRWMIFSNFQMFCKKQLRITSDHFYSVLIKRAANGSFYFPD